MKHNTRPEVLLVTGSSRGIGAEICRQVANDGWSVCVNYASSTNEADEVVEFITQQGGKAVAIRADVSNEEEVVAMFDQIDRQLGRISGLVNCAGVNGCNSRVDEMIVLCNRRYSRCERRLG